MHASSDVLQRTYLGIDAQPPERLAVQRHPCLTPRDVPLPPVSDVAKCGVIRQESAQTQLLAQIFRRTCSSIMHHSGAPPSTTTGMIMCAALSGGEPISHATAAAPAKSQEIFCQPRKFVLSIMAFAHRGTVGCRGPGVHALTDSPGGI